MQMICESEPERERERKICWLDLKFQIRGPSTHARDRQVRQECAEPAIMRGTMNEEIDQIDHLFSDNFAIIILMPYPKYYESWKYSEEKMSEFKF